MHRLGIGSSPRSADASFKHAARQCVILPAFCTGSLASAAPRPAPILPERGAAGIIRRSDAFPAVGSKRYLEIACRRRQLQMPLGRLLLGSSLLLFQVLDRKSVV